MEMSVENSSETTISSNDVGHNAHTEDLEPQLVNHGDAEAKSEITDEEVRSILEVIAATGNFWHDWDTLKTLLSFRLKQVLAEYPETQMVTDQQISSLGETHAELVTRLDEALLGFMEGPPFTLQRLCEILLTAKSIYPNLSKLALALEKNLSVTSTITIASDPYPSTMIGKTGEPEKGSVESGPPLAPLQNGVGAPVGDQDEEMADAEEIDKVGEAEEDMVDKVEEDTVDKVDEVTVSKVDEATVGKVDEATADKVDEAMADKVDEAKVDKVDEATVDKVDGVTVDKVDEATVDKVDEATVDKVDEATVDKVDEATVDKVDDDTVDKVDEDIKDAEKDATEETIIGTLETSFDRSNNPEPSGESPLSSEQVNPVSQ